MTQIDFWRQPLTLSSPPKAERSETKGKQWYLVNSMGYTFRWHEAGDEAALERAEALAIERKSNTTLHQELPGEGKVRARVGPRVGVFDQTGKRIA